MGYNVSEVAYIVSSGRKYVLDSINADGSALMQTMDFKGTIDRSKGFSVTCADLLAKYKMVSTKVEVQ